MENPLIARYREWLIKRGKQYKQEHGKAPSTEWFYRQQSHLIKRQAIYFERVERLMVATQKGFGKEADLRKLRNQAVEETLKQKPDLKMIQDAANAARIEIGDFKRILAKIRATERIAEKIGQEKPDFGDIGQRLHLGIQADIAFIRSLREWNKRRKSQ